MQADLIRVKEIKREAEEAHTEASRQRSRQERFEGKVEEWKTKLSGSPRKGWSRDRHERRCHERMAYWEARLRAAVENRRRAEQWLTQLVREAQWVQATDRAAPYRRGV